MTIVDVFCGAGGASEGARQLGFDVVGVELDPVAAAVHEAAGHRTIVADAATFDLATLAGVEGLWMSPPCPDFSTAGRGAGLEGESGPLVWEVRRWALGLRPRWVTCEQVPPVLPLWRVIAHDLRAAGYSTWVGLLRSEEFGVPQTRTRAILLASLDGPVHPPEPTHQRYRPGEPAQATPADLFSPGRLPWVSMADALGWCPAETLHTRCGYDGVEVTREADEPALTFTSKSGTQWVRLTHDHPSQPNRATRNADEPAPTIAFGHDAASWVWERTLHTRYGYGEVESTRETGQWVWERPATTIMGDPRVSPPGHHGTEANSQHGPGTVRLAVAEAATLQGFPARYPWPAGKTAAFRCIGNAVPPPLAAACIGAAARIDWRPHVLAATG